MGWRLSPALWLPGALAVVVLAGSFALRSRAFVQQTERDATAYGDRPAWLACFDATSATCGVGLLTFDIEREYTAAGRWLLIGLSLVGGTLYVLAVQQGTRAVRLTVGDGWPRVVHVVVGFFVLTAAGSLLAGALVAWQSQRQEAFCWGAWHAASALTSAGFSNPAEVASGRRVFALLALVSACVWPLWLTVGSKTWVWRARGAASAPANEATAPAPGASAAAGRRRAAWWRLRVLGIVSSYAACLLLAAGLIALLESPRGGVVQPERYGQGASATKVRPDERLSRMPAAARFRESFTQVEAASGAGLPTLAIGDRAIGEGSKLVLALIVLIGPLHGAPGGGISWNVFLWGLAAVALSLRRRPPFAVPPARDSMPHARMPRAGGSDLWPVRTAAIALIAAVVAFWLIVALGLFVIENRVGSPFRAAPTLGDVLLEAASAVAGAGITTGLTADLTAATLSSGIRQKVDMYQYGMTWLMTAMFIGRILPILVLARLAALAPANAACGIQHAEFSAAPSQ